MNKKLLAAAVAAAVVASPAAFAESTVYGKMHASIDAIDYDDQQRRQLRSQQPLLASGLQGLGRPG